MSLKRKMRGFTLIELMIVVAIIGILAAIAIPKFAELVTKSKEASVKGSVGSVRSALSIYYGDMEGFYPINLFVGLADGGKYMPTGNLGSYRLPATKNNAGHDVVVDSDAEVYQAASSKDAVGGLWYVSGADAQVYVNCSHNDLKGSSWTSY